MDELVDFVVVSTRRVLERYEVRLDHYGEVLLRQALKDGRCVQITIPVIVGQKVCPVAVVDNKEGSRVWFVYAGTRERALESRFNELLRERKNQQQGARAVL